MLKIVFHLVTGGASDFWPAGRVEQGTAGIFINKQTLSIWTLGRASFSHVLGFIEFECADHRQIYPDVTM